MDIRARFAIMATFSPESVAGFLCGVSMWGAKECPVCRMSHVAKPWWAPQPPLWPHNLGLPGLMRQPNSRPMKSSTAGIASLGPCRAD